MNITKILNIRGAAITIVADMVQSDWTIYLLWG